MKEFIGAEKYKCMKCEYIYDPFFGDPEGGIEPGVSFENLPEDWVCPICGAGKHEKMVPIPETERRKKKLNLFVKQLFGRERYRCFRCGYVYDPLTGDLKNGIERGTNFENLPHTWSCPDCGAGKNEKM
ncbi:MAG: rubredoxin [Planctomycetes bacterium]|nr:rubredoxin [Planctomycetota bacterium]